MGRQTLHISVERLLVRAILGQTRASAQMSDAYKFAMAQAGFPLREETFCLTFRKGGPFYIPFDLNAVVQALLPLPQTAKEAAFLTANGYGLTPAMEHALTLGVKVVCPPKGAWINKGEPVLTVTGPSFLVSWLEPLLIMIQYPIQIATAAMQGERDFPATCADEVQILRTVESTLVESALLEAPFRIHLDTKGYLARVRANIQATVDALGGPSEAHRAFDVGLRAATCMQQHLMVLEVARSLGVLKTSNVFGAWKLYMIPVGTTGHEHQMRWGQDDRNGFRAIRDMRPEPPSYLFDTTDPLNIGIPAAMDVMIEDPDRPCSMRFDSGDQDAQFLKIAKGCEQHALHPNLIFEDSYNAEKTTKNEAFCDSHGWPKEHRMYGFGGYWVSQPATTIYNRDRVSAAYKLTKTAGRSVIKRSGSPGKESIPGLPVILEDFILNPDDSVTIEHLIAQEGEVVQGYRPPLPHVFTAAQIKTFQFRTVRSPATIKLINQLCVTQPGLVSAGAA